MARIALGLDFGTESVRALLLDVDNATEAGEAVEGYPHGVMDTALPTGEALARDWALQHPGDWVQTAVSVIRSALRESGVKTGDLIGMGVDFTACTPLPVSDTGMPLCLMDPWVREPHAWPKLWKHHGAREETRRINELASDRGEPFLRYYGGMVGLEWLLPKAWQVLREAPAVYEAAHRFIEGGDWMVQQLTGQETRNACAAGYKALWNSGDGYPSEDFLRHLDPALAGFYREKVGGPVVPPGKAAGRISDEAADRFGLPTGLPVSAATIDAHAGVPGAGVNAPGTMVIIMGTSSCHMALSETPCFFEGFAGMVKDGILPGYYGYESGQAAVGDIFAWFLDHSLAGAVAEEAQREGVDLHTLLSRKAAALRPGETGLIALDWHQGNRSILMDGNLSGALLGLTLNTRPEEMYRAFLEATAFGTRIILDSYTRGGVPVDTLVACGGLARKNPFLMQLYADITGRPIHIAASDQTVARGAAVFGALAAGTAGSGFRTTPEAVASLGCGFDRTVNPDADAQAVYDRLHSLYRNLHDHFGKTSTEVMYGLREIAGESGPDPAVC